jgi:hypothetical protein
MPLTDLELNRVYDACDRLPKVEWKNHLGSGHWGGANIFLRMHKTKGALFTWVDDWLYRRDIHPLEGS